jgi:hypothetical protein
MGILDKAKAALEGAKDKAADLAHDHGDKISGAIDKAGELVDKGTKGKYATKIDSAQAKAKEAVVKLGDAADATDGADPAGGAAETTAGDETADPPAPASPDAPA